MAKTFKKIIKDDLKSKGLIGLAKLIKSVRYETYSMGNSLNIVLEGATDSQREKFAQFIEPYEYGTFDGMTDSSGIKNQNANVERQAKHVFVEHVPAPTSPAQVGEAPELTAQKKIATDAVDRAFAPPKKLQAATGFSLDETQAIVDTFAEPTADIDADELCERCLQELTDDEAGQEHCNVCSAPTDEAAAEQEAAPVIVSFRNASNEVVFEVPFAPGLDVTDALKDAAEMARTYNKTAEQEARICGLFVGRSYVDLIDLAKNGRS